MELIESVMWIALGFGPTMAALAGISKTKLFKIYTAKKSAGLLEEGLSLVR